MTGSGMVEAPKGTEIQEYKEILLGRLTTVLEDVRSLEEEESATAGNATGLSIHSADLGSDHAAHAIRLGCMDSAIAEIMEIRQALAGLRNGTFGRCESCGHAIGSIRLKAIPYANLCLSCKKSEEAVQFCPSSKNC